MEVLSPSEADATDIDDQSQQNVSDYSSDDVVYRKDGRRNSVLSGGVKVNDRRNPDCIGHPASRAKQLTHSRNDLSFRSRGDSKWGRRVRQRHRRKEPVADRSNQLSDLFVVQMPTEERADSMLAKGCPRSQRSPSPSASSTLGEQQNHSSLPE